MTDSNAKARSRPESTEEMNRVDYHFTSFHLFLFNITNIFNINFFKIYPRQKLHSTETQYALWRPEQRKHERD